MNSRIPLSQFSSAQSELPAIFPVILLKVRQTFRLSLYWKNRLIQRGRFQNSVALVSLCFVSTFCLRFYSFLYLLYFTCNAQEVADTCSDRNRLGSEHCRRIAMNCRQMFVAVKLNSVIVVMVTYLFANVCLRLMYLLFAYTVHFFIFIFSARTVIKRQRHPTTQHNRELLV